MLFYESVWDMDKLAAFMGDEESTENLDFSKFVLPTSFGRLASVTANTQTPEISREQVYSIPSALRSDILLRKGTERMFLSNPRDGKLQNQVLDLTLSRSSDLVRDKPGSIQVITMVYKTRTDGVNDDFIGGFQPR